MDDATEAAYTTSAGRAAVGASRGCPAELHFDIHAPRAPAARRHPVLCVMGFLTDGIQFWPQLNALCGRGHLVCTFDNRGIGRSSASAPPYTTAQMACDALELLAHLGWVPETTHLIGVSMGGMIALEMLAGSHNKKGSGRARAFQSGSLLVTTPTGPVHHPFPWRWGGPPLSTFVSTFRQLFDPTLSEREASLMAMGLNFRRDWLLRDSGYLHPRTGDALTNMKRVMRVGTKIWFAKKNDGVDPRAGWRGIVGHMCAVATHHVSMHRLEAIRASGVPILVVGVTDDNLVQHELGSKVLERVLRPVESLVLQSGHGVNMECSAEVNAAIVRLFAMSERGDGAEAENEHLLAAL
jgi:pimeloyl-ACP methyl ester carboxylesterase